MNEPDEPRAPTYADSDRDARTGRIGSYMMLVLPSKQLAAVVGHRTMPRSKVFRKVWDYIDQHGLRDTVSGQVRADEALRLVFGERRVPVLGVNRLIAKHLRRP